MGERLAKQRKTSPRLRVSCSDRRQFAKGACMNVHDKTFATVGDIAAVRYGDGEFTVLRPGRYVICAVSGKKIALDDLRYWSPVLQEAYAGPAQALARWQAMNPNG